MRGRREEGSVVVVGGGGEGGGGEGCEEKLVDLTVSIESGTESSID